MRIKAPWDRFLMMIGLSLFLLLFNMDGPLLGGFLINLLFTVVYWEGNYQIVTYFRERFPKIDQTTRRIVLQIALSMLYTLSVNVIIILILDLSSLIPYESQFHLTTLMIGVIVTVIISTIYETVFYFQLWKNSLLESEELKKTEARLQFESLKNQVNPHFLFNSLNTLSALIHVDPDKAEEFVQQFSRIYRYVLEVKDSTFVPLQEEIDFVKSYVFLQKIRFDNQLKFTISTPLPAGQEGSMEKKAVDALQTDEPLETIDTLEADDALYSGYFIPPLILQNLVENCIKHNIISKKYPLSIELLIHDEVVIVKNKLRERTDHSDSTKTGLYNIQQRLKLLNDQEPRFYKKDGYFYAEVPLIKSS